MDLKQGMEILETNRTFRAILATLLAVGNFLNGVDVNTFVLQIVLFMNDIIPEIKFTFNKI